jgi:ABC-type sugar transport system ATPase subunit
MMIGRSIDLARAAGASAGTAGEDKGEGSDGLRRSPAALVVKNLSSPGRFSDVSFAVRGGEIVGLAGLVGSGRSELAQAIFGLDPCVSGRIEVDGATLKLCCVQEAMRHGIGLVPEDRKRQGLVLGMSGRANFSLAMLDRLRRFGLLDRRRERNEAQSLFDRLRVKTPSLEAAVATLSGGNQQKVVLAKWLARSAKILIVDEPTRGVDVGAKAAIHQILLDLARQGTAIVMISSELPEVLTISTRILIMRQGRLAGEIPAAGATQERVLRLMADVGAQDRGAACAG